MVMWLLSSCRRKGHRFSEKVAIQLNDTHPMLAVPVLVSVAHAGDLQAVYPGYGLCGEILRQGSHKIAAAELLKITTIGCGCGRQAQRIHRLLSDLQETKTDI